jgi:hypothetical protein
VQGEAAGPGRVRPLVLISALLLAPAPFLREAQKRDILYHNAARSLRLSEEEIARYHGG